MSTPTIVVLILVAPVTVAVLVVVGRVLTRRATAALVEAKRTYERVEPLLDQLERDAQVTAREMERIDGALERWRRERDARRGRPTGPVTGPLDPNQG